MNPDSFALRQTFCISHYLKLRLPAFVLLALLAIPYAAFSDGCAPPPAGMVSFWPADGTAMDVVGGNHGTLVGNVGFLPGKVSQAFVLDGDGDAVLVGAAPSLQLQDLTIEGWIKRSSSTLVSFNGNGNGEIFVLGTNPGGYGLQIEQWDNSLVFLKSGGLQVGSGVAIADTNWHHIAVTKMDTRIVFYVDGVAYPAPPTDMGLFTFSAPGYIGGWQNPFGVVDNSFYGMIDDLAIYARELSASEIGAIYQAGSMGKCVQPVAPAIISQPTSQTAFVTGSAAFSVTATGTAPLSYQWKFGETAIPGATDSTLTLSSLQSSNAGTYWVVVTNAVGSATSSNAQLTVLPLPSCAVAPTGLISWWRGEGNASDAASGNYGLLAGDVSFAPAQTGQGFLFDGGGDAMQLGNPANLRLQNLTIEAWIKRSSATAATLDASVGVQGQIFAYGQGGYALCLEPDGRLHFTRIGVSNVKMSYGGVTDLNWHHVAVTRSGTTVVFYVDSVPFPVATAYSDTFTFTTAAAIGGRGDNLGQTFYGMIDEVSIYSRALSDSEIHDIYLANLSGKCVAPVPPSIVAHPQNTNALVGTSVMLSVVAGGSLPLNYQWLFNGTGINNATSASFTITNIDFVHVGAYAVQVSNIAGAVISSNANVTVTYPTPVIRVGSTSLMAGSTFALPVTLPANGNENTLGFSLNFNTQRLAFAGAVLGGGAGGATLFVNTSLSASGRVGIVVAKPAQSTFARGTQEVVRVSFRSLPLLGGTPANAINGFTDQPVLRELLDAQLQPLSASYANGTVTLAPTVFESDLSPRTSGNQAVSGADWVQAGRFVVRLDTPTPSANEFQRVDCAPRLTLGDGQLKVTDWVQAGRYLAGLDPLAAIGGPASETAPTIAGPSAERQLRVGTKTILQGQAFTVSVELEAQGDENAIGFTLGFDSSAFTFSSVSLGGGAVGGYLLPNTSQAASGRLGILLALPTGSTLSAGTREIVSVSFAAIPSATGVFPLTLNDQLITRCVSDVQAAELAVSCFDSTVKVNSTNPPPSLSIAHTADEIRLSWPLWATNFTLQAADSMPPASANWTNLPVIPAIDTGEAVVKLPVSGEARFYRLFLP